MPAPTKWLHRGAVCRVGTGRGVAADVRGQRVKINSIRGDGFVSAQVRSGSAKGAKLLLSWDDVGTCSQPRGAKKRRR